MFGGHETTASTIYYTLVFLAMHPSSQRLLQSSLDSQFPTDSLDHWNYDTDLPHLLATMPGAVLNETLRLIPPIMQMPKTTLGLPQPLEVDGKTLYVPPHTKVNVVISAAHRNPNSWPKQRKSLEEDSDIETRSRISNENSAGDSTKDLDSFRPERWLSSPTSPTTINNESLPTTLPFRPQKGAYIPFSDGRRSCIGRRFALIEAVAVVATIFRSYSVELAVDIGSGSDPEAGQDEGGNERTKRDAWYAAAETARFATREGLSAVSFQRKKSVPLRLVKRGEEQFWAVGA